MAKKAPTKNRHTKPPHKFHHQKPPRKNIQTRSSIAPLDTIPVDQSATPIRESPQLTMPYLGTTLATPPRHLRVPKPKASHSPISPQPLTAIPIVTALMAAAMITDITCGIFYPTQKRSYTLTRSLTITEILNLSDYNPAEVSVPTPTGLNSALVPQCAMFSETVNSDQRTGGPLVGGCCYPLTPTAGVSD